MKMSAALLAAFPRFALAEDWAPLDGAAIAEALTDQSLIYANARQTFFASGRTLYNAGQDSWGYWAVRGDQYCSQWPPSDGWDCYDVARLSGQVRFTAADGSTIDGEFVE